MSRIAVTLALASAVGFATGSSATDLANTPREAVKVTELIRTDLPGAPWQETQVYLVELAPGATTINHHHPGHSFVYVLAGATRLVQQGSPQAIFSSGQAFHQLPRTQNDFENPSNTLPAKFVVFSVLPKDSPYWTQPM